MGCMVGLDLVEFGGEGMTLCTPNTTPLHQEADCLIIYCTPLKSMIDIRDNTTLNDTNMGKLQQATGRAYWYPYAKAIVPAILRSMSKGRLNSRRHAKMCSVELSWKQITLQIEFEHLLQPWLARRYNLSANGIF